MAMNLYQITRASMLSTVLAASAFAQANSAPSQQWSVLTTVKIKPEFRQEYESVQKEITAAYVKGGAHSRVLVQTMFGDIDEYTSIVPLAKFADLDEPTALVKALGEAGSQRLLKRAGAYMVSLQRQAYLSLPDISIQTPTENPAPYAEVTFMRLFPGKAAEFASFMKDDYLPAMKKLDIANLWTSRPIFGGDLNERVTVMPMQKLAELDGGPLLTKALGAEGARTVNAKRNTIVESTRYMIVRVRPELSHMPSPSKPKPAAE